MWKLSKPVWVLTLDLGEDGLINLDVEHPNLKIAHNAPCHGIDPRDAHPFFDFGIVDVDDKAFDYYVFLNNYTASKGNNLPPVSTPR